MDGDVLGQYLAVDHKRRHFVLRIYPQVLGREILPLAVIERPDLEIGARFGQCDVGSECAGVRGIVKSDFHLCLLISVIDHCESSALAVLDFFEKLFGLLFVLSIVGKLCGESPNGGEKTSR